ncbi:MAG: winged helix-turn-helix transcriptional regulator [Rhodocyclaceae bacterium]|jgi:predicted nucleotidyltransferase|nr:winged helix-turn-helix transcriptional regulator [Rhodocyclaceae bacterium]
MLQSLSNILFPDYRRRVMELLLLHPERSAHVREIARLTGTSAGTLHKELSRLAEAGILQRNGQGRQVYYAANRSCPIFEELASILRKTSGLADVLREALAPVADRLRAALVFGSVAKGTEQAGSDVDVLVVGDVGFAEIVRLMHPAQSTIGREINPKVFSPDEWQARLAAKDPFALDVLVNPKILLIGNGHDHAEVGGHQP